MLTSENLSGMEGPNRNNSSGIIIEPKDRLIQQALKLYQNELEMPPNLDLGLHSESRAQLRKRI